MSGTIFYGILYVSSIIFTIAIIWKYYWKYFKFEDRSTFVDILMILIGLIPIINLIFSFGLFIVDVLFKRKIKKSENHLKEIK